MPDSNKLFQKVTSTGIAQLLVAIPLLIFLMTLVVMIFPRFSIVLTNIIQSRNIREVLLIILFAGIFVVPVFIAICNIISGRFMLLFQDEKEGEKLHKGIRWMNISLICITLLAGSSVGFLTLILVNIRL